MIFMIDSKIKSMLKFNSTILESSPMTGFSIRLKTLMADFTRVSEHCYQLQSQYVQ